VESDVLRATCRTFNERYCAYEKAILTGQAACSLAQRFCIAEREGVHCGADAAQADCIELLGILRRQARFTLKTVGTPADGPAPSAAALTHAKALRIQLGGLRGLQRLLAPAGTTARPVEDIRGLILAAMAAFGSLNDLPFQAIIQQVAACRPGRRPRRGG
jgi:hypothetical protein